VFQILQIKYINVRKSVSLSFTLNKNKKVKQYIIKETHKPTFLRFWVKDNIIFLCMFGPFFFLIRSPRLCPLESVIVRIKA